jgi:hypothetical protein
MKLGNQRLNLRQKDVLNRKLKELQKQHLPYQKQSSLQYLKPHKQNEFLIRFKLTDQVWRGDWSRNV